MAKLANTVSIKKKRIDLEIKNFLKNRLDFGPGDFFCDRCYVEDERCATETPKMEELDKGHFVCCHKCADKFIRKVYEFGCEMQ